MIVKHEDRKIITVPLTAMTVYLVFFIRSFYKLILLKFAFIISVL